MLTFFIVLIVFSILIIVHELGHLFVAKKVGVRVERFSLGFGKKLFGIKKGGTEYVLSLFPLGGYVKLAGDDPTNLKGTPEEFFSKSPLKRFLVIVGGPLTNYIFAIILFSLIFMMGIPLLTSRVGKLLEDYPAASSGVKVGDLIVEIDEKKVEYWDDFAEIVKKDIGGVPLKFKIKRGERILNLRITPKVVETKNVFGQKTSIGLIGVFPKQDIVLVKHNPFQAVALGSKEVITVTAATYKGIWLLITGGLPIKESVSGPIGIAVLISEAAKMGFIYLLIIMAHINIALAVFNLLPFPILDGGHVLFLGIEKLRGKPVSPRTQETIGNIALYILITFALFISWNDIVKFLPFMKK